MPFICKMEIKRIASFVKNTAPVICLVLVAIMFVLKIIAISTQIDIEFEKCAKGNISNITVGNCHNVRLIDEFTGVSVCDGVIDIRKVVKAKDGHCEATEIGIPLTPRQLQYLVALVPWILENLMPT